jgi:O-antigen ligase
LELTPIAAVLVPLSLYCFFFKPDFLYWCLVFSLPFSATAVANIGFMSSTSGLQATIWLGSLWLLRETPRVLKKTRVWNSEQMGASFRHLWFFLCVVVLSLAMPLWINGRLTIECQDLSCNTTEALKFSLRHITQTMYLIFGILLTVFVAERNSNPREFKKSVQVFLISGTFVSFWGLLQWYCYRVGATYPAFIFNNSQTESAMGYLQELGDLGVTRISSVATEPSMFAQCSLIALIFAIFAVFGGRVLISKFWDRIALVVVFVVLLLTTSSTAYVGLAVLVPTSLIGLWYLRRLNAKIVLVVGSAVFLLYLVYAHSQLGQNVIYEMIFSKGESYSGFGRLNSVLLASTYFWQYPILGIGWGSASCYDLIFKLLSNIGIVGLFVFGLFLKSVFGRLWKSMKPRRPKGQISEHAYWACCLLVAVFILMVTNELTGFAYWYSHLWFVFGMALAVPILRYSTREYPNAKLQLLAA